ncbi:hypothetical protein MASR2M79_23500 [Aminivibrio sp.]
MAKKHYLFSSESVTEGHPDKVADQISDGILDAILERDPMGRVACEVLCTTGLVMVAGEISTETYVDIPKIAREIVKKIGYTRAKYGFDGDTCAVLTAIDEQSENICRGVNSSLEVREQQSAEELEKTGAGDQGMMVGFACNETEEYLPMSIALAHRLARRLAEVRKDKTLPYLRPDGKTQVTLEYEDCRAVRAHTIVISAQHHPKATAEQIRKDIQRYVIDPVMPSELMTADTRILVNPTACFEKGGPMADTGSPAGRSSSTPTADGSPTEEGPSRGRTRRRWTAPAPIWPGMPRRTWWPQGSPISAFFRSPTPSVWRSLYPS